jgi:hypothetical protein
MGNEKPDRRTDQDDEGRGKTGRSESARGGPISSEETHTQSGAPTDKAHSEDGDGSLTGSIPAGLTPDELRRIAKEDKIVEPGTG